MPAILLRPQNPRGFRGGKGLKGIKTKIMAELMAEGKEISKAMQQPTETWKGSKPRFKIIRISSSQQIGVHVYPDRTSLGGQKYVWLDEGTRIRWAVMSGDWRSKTRVGSWRSGSGGGRVIIVGRKAMNRRKIKARPGIKARGWTKMARKQREQPFRRRMRRVFEVYARSWAR
jgi:hypothetical protein